MSAAPEVTFFMLVTDADALIAEYAIRSYRLLRREKINFRLRVYGNCLSPIVRDRYFPRWQKYSFVELDDNRAHVTPNYPKAGTLITSPEGFSHPLYGDWETCATIWYRELQKLPTPFVATVDADFEILDPAFVEEAMERLRSAPDLAGVSSTYGPDRPAHYETYRQQTVFMHQRWDTWFCIYRKSCLDVGISPYLHEQTTADGMVHVYDAFGYLQHALLAKGWRFEAVGPEFQNQFIHYAAFVQNQHVTTRNIAAYRRYRILMHRGLIPRLGFKGARGRLNRWVGYGAQELFIRRFGGVDRSRRQLQHLLNPDFNSKTLYQDRNLHAVRNDGVTH